MLGRLVTSIALRRWCSKCAWRRCEVAGDDGGEKTGVWCCGECHGQLNLREKMVFIKWHKSGYLRGWSYLRTSSALRVSTASDSMH